MSFKEYPHRRLNLLTGEWVLVSPHRTKRPWQGKQETPPADDRPQYDPSCYLCPGNERAGGEKNPNYQEPFVFTNDFAALLSEGPDNMETGHDLLRAEAQKGTCRVICFSPRHDLSLPEMKVSEIQKVISVWQEQLQELGEKYQWVQIFENKGAIMGCSNPHPHGQIWASSQLPNEATKELREQKNYFQKKNASLLVDYVELELKEKERVVEENEHWVVLIPFWAIWPYETLLLPKRAGVETLLDLSEEEKGALADIMKKFLSRYDNLFQISFPYSMGWHGAPSDGKKHPYWQLHAHFYPPLLRSATVKKFMVGYEMLAEAQRDITPEQAAETLRNLSNVHYKEK